MLNIGLAGRTTLEILCLGAHCDDIEIGCGGTILRLIEEGIDLSVRWIVFASTPQRKEEAIQGARAFLQGVSGSTVMIEQFRDGFLPYAGVEIKEYFEHLKTQCNPDIVFSHYRDDRHQDHRVISDLTWNTFRNHLVLEYEVPKYDGDLGSPNFFVHLDKPICQRKVSYLLTSYASQAEKQWFSEDTFRALMRLRGIESNAPSTYAEAFYCRKLTL